uniref:SHSP domain-containing protein n=1 Tax=Panagrolaimus sp. PS1159 TaxID=55785 RepID=A0AC35GFJ7_9BILA
DNGQFKFAFDIQDYKPEELKIDVEGRDLIVAGNHKSEDEHGILEKQFTRRFTIPENIDLETIKCDFDEKNRALEIYGKKHEIKDSEKKSIKIGMKPKEVEAKKSDETTAEKQQQQ